MKQEIHQSTQNRTDPIQIAAGNFALLIFHYLKLKQYPIIQFI